MNTYTISINGGIIGYAVAGSEYDALVQFGLVVPHQINYVCDARRDIWTYYAANVAGANVQISKKY